ncbi:MAG: glycosyltransferase [Thaumarchaeota archaeon]|nr:glycosyltransferase [Nitrososphaerota archaeon]
MDDDKTSRIQKCASCNGELLFNEKTVRHENNWYHSKCFTPIPKYTKVKKPPKLPKRTQKPKRIDPYLIVLTGLIFAVLFTTAYFMFSTLTLISISAAAVVIFIQLFSSGPLETKYKYKRRIPSFFSLFLMISPFVFGTLVAIDGYSLWQSISKSILLWGLTMTFWSTMLFIPLSVYSKYKEDNQKESKYFPSISIIIPAYNEEKIIANTIEGLLSEDYPEKEIVMVNDGSTDKTLEVANKYKNQIKILSKSNGGKATAMNYALNYCSGEIIVVVDADTIIGVGSLKELVQGFQSEKVAAIAGNIKIRNVSNWITGCQSLEYIASIQVIRRVFDYFGAIPIVPGALGAFRKSALMASGVYDKSTIVEDFDCTLKVAKAGYIVQGTVKAIAYTEAPNTIRDFIKQRKRWYRGNLQVYKRHIDILRNPRFGFLQRLAFPFMLLSAVIMPIVGVLVLASTILTALQGEIIFVVQTIVFFTCLQFLVSLLALRIDGESPKLAALSIFSVFGYKQLLDFLLIRAIFETLFKRKATWTSAKRIGI